MPTAQAASDGTLAESHSVRDLYRARHLACSGQSIITSRSTTCQSHYELLLLLCSHDIQNYWETCFILPMQVWNFIFLDLTFKLLSLVTYYHNYKTDIASIIEINSRVKKTF